MVSRLPSNGPWAVLQVDLRNAFNSISREEVLVAVSEHAPQLLPWVISCYGAHSKLYCQGKATLSSEEGVQPGDPLGPLLFALAWHKVVKDSAVNMIWSSWYLDDGHLIGNIRDLASAFATI